MPLYIYIKTVEECQAKIRQLQQINNKEIVLQWSPRHCQIAGNEAADSLAKKGARILQTHTTDLSYHSIYI